MRNLEKLFSKPLPSTRGGSFYNTFPYPTKISPEAIAVYIASATNPDDTVLDAFAGSGSTGIAALLAEHPTEKMQETANALGVEPIWGKGMQSYMKLVHMPHLLQRPSACSEVLS